MSGAITTPRRRRAIVAVTLSVAAGLTLGGTISWTVADASPGHADVTVAATRPTPTRPSTRPRRPAPHRPSPACSIVSHQAKSYCVGSLEGIIDGRYGIGASIALYELDVIDVSSTTGRAVVTVRSGGNPTSTCAPTPGHFCGARSADGTLAIDWPLARVPAVRSTIFLFGVTLAGSIVPDDFTVLY